MGENLVVGRAERLKLLVGVVAKNGVVVVMTPECDGQTRMMLMSAQEAEVEDCRSRHRQCWTMTAVRGAVRRLVLGWS